MHFFLSHIIIYHMTVQSMTPCYRHPDRYLDAVGGTTAFGEHRNRNMSMKMNSTSTR